ncbi:hypothetical protein MPER_01961, partial [Moniliophthora perniciosa FA553]
GLDNTLGGGLKQSPGGVSIFRSLKIDTKIANPKLKGINDFTNNVVYNWGGGEAGDSDGPSSANIMNNIFISGPDTSAHPFTRGNENFEAYVKDNYYVGVHSGTS